MRLEKPAWKWSAVGGLAALLAAGVGCRAPARIPYDLTAVPTRPKPVHPLKVAILPLEVARDPREAPDAAGLYLYNGRAYRGTRLEGLGRDPGAHLTEVLARHLARARVFAQVILVLRPEQAPEADLLLSGKVRRARGYVEAEASADASDRPEDARAVLAEVVLEDLTLRPREGPARITLDVGWSIAEDRPLDAEGQPPAPWGVLADALRVSLDDLVRVLSEADLSGGFEVREQVALALEPVKTATLSAPFAALPESPPEGWRPAHTSTAARPSGWSGAAGCDHLRLEARQSRRFSRLLGPYTPALDLWACSDRIDLRFEGRADHPARLLGRRDGRWYFGLQLGRTNWRDAPAQVARYLALEPPPQRYLFEVGPSARGAPDAPRLRLRSR